MINRLQFLHHEDTFTGNTTAEARQSAVEFLTNQYFRQVEKPSLYAEPLIVRYENKENPDKPNIILAIGSTGTGGTKPTRDSQYFLIDAEGIKDDVKEKYDEIQKSLANFAFTVLDTNTIDLEKIVDNGNVNLKANAKVPNKVLINDENLSNIIKTSENGIYSYVNLEFDERTNSFLFQVNDKVEEFSIPVIKSGKYDISKECIVFTLSDGNTIDVDVDDLIDEWVTEGEKSNTPIVLTKEKHTDKNTNLNDRNEDNWKDLLKADIRIASDKKHNILEKTADGRNLYVKGTADNIFFKDGKNVKEAIENIKTEVSSALTKNIIFKDYGSNGEYEGIAASVDLSYSKETNVLVFTRSDNNGSIVRDEFKLNSASFIDDISYDTVNQTVIIRYKDEDGKIHKTDIDLSNLLDDWVTNSESHTVELKKQVNHGNKDVLSADVKILDKTDDNYQILQEREHKLFVKGTADNIHYEGNENVKEAIDRLSDDIETQNTKVKELSGSSYFEVGNTNSISMSKDNNSNAHTVKAELKISPKTNNTLVVDGNNGVYTSIDYDSDRNVIIVSDTNNSTHKREIQLNSVSTIEYMRYDASREKIVIAYKSNSTSSSVKTLEIPITDVLSEWKVSNNGHNVRMTKSSHLVDGVDNLSSDVVIATEGNYADNLIKEVSLTLSGDEMKALYVSGEQVAAKAREWATEEATTIAAKALQDAKAYTDNVHTTITGEIEAAKNKAIESSNTNVEDKVAQLSSKFVNDAVSSAKTYTDSELTKLSNNVKSYSDTIVANEAQERKAQDTLVNTKLDSETSARRDADTTLQTNLVNEISKREAADTALDAKISKEVDERTKADKLIQDDALNKLDIAKTYAETKANDALRDSKSYTDTKNETLSGSIKNYVDSEINNITLVGTTTDTAKVNVDGKKISADVRVASGNKNRILHNADGLYVGDISAKYDAQTNTLTINGIDGNPVLTQKLNSASFIDSITYDKNSHTLNIVYHTTDGNVITVPPIDLTGLILDIAADETSNTPIEIIVPHAVQENGVSVKKIKADVNIAQNVEGNILKTVMQGGKGALMADASGILRDVKEISASTNSLTGLTDGIQTEINRIESSVGLDRDGNYVASDKPYISGATSFTDADKKLADAVANVDNSIKDLLQGSKTYSVNVFADRTNTNSSTIKAEARLALAKDQNESELTRKKIPHGNEYEGNLLQIIKAESEGSVVEMGDKVNGLYFGGSIDYGMMVGDNNIV